MILTLLKSNIAKIAKMHAKLTARSGDKEKLYELYYLGKKLKIIEDVDANRSFESARVEDNRCVVELVAPLNIETKERIREHIYKNYAPTLFLDRVEKFAHQMQLFPSRVSFRKAKTRWGSCSSKNSISLNIALTALPRYLSDYIIVHELAHIKEKNHSKAFWSLVEQHYPNYKVAREELKKFAIVLQ